MDLAEIRKHNRRLVDDILGESNKAKRARLIKTLWLKMNPRIKLNDGSMSTAKLQDMLITEAVKRKKKMWQAANPRAGSRTTIKGERGQWGTQVAYEVPANLMTLLEAFNHDMFEGAGDEQKKNFRRVMRGLPEYQIPDRTL